MRLLMFALVYLFSTAAFSTSYNQYDVFIERLGSHNGQVFYLSLDKEYATNCAWGNLYCSETEVSCERYYPLILAAKMSSKKLSRIDYKQDEPGASCKITLVEIE